MDLKTALTSKHLLFDGAMGTYLQMSGLTSSDLAEEWNISHAEIVKGIHASYVLAGSNVITANSFGANELALKKHNASDMSYAYTCAAIENAKAAAQDKAYTVVNLGPTGQLLTPGSEITFDDVYNSYLPQVKAAKDKGADGIIIETMIDLAEARAAFLAAKENSNLPVIVSFTISNNDTTVMGNHVCAIASVFDAMGADCIALNCSGGPEQMLSAIESIKERTTKPLLIQPNAGLPQTQDGKLVYPYSPAQFQGAMQKVLDLGVQHVGGCCGTSPDHIRHLNAIFPKDQPFETEEPLHPYMLATPRACFSINYSLPDPLVLDPNDSDETFTDKVMDYAIENELFYLDISAIAPERLSGLINILNYLNYPLVLTTQNPELCLTALRYYNGIAGVIHNPSLHIEDMQKYGAILI